MTMQFRLRTREYTDIARVLGIALLVWLSGSSATVHADDSVTIDQAPLTVQESLPANIVLMLDDSGSMIFDYMPDRSYLTGNGNNLDVLHYWGENGTYYNPGVTYTPPPTADGGSYPDSPGIGEAYENGFTDRSTTHDVTQWEGGKEYSRNLSSYTGYDLNFPYYERFTSTQTVSYDPSYDWRGNPRCYSGGSYNSRTRMCERTTYSYVYLFTYTLPDSYGNYVSYYVGKSASDCDAAPSGSSCDYSAETQQNVANWFSYYRTRMLMAKSGLMTAMSSLASTYRVGFGSINNGNTSMPNAATYNGVVLSRVSALGDGSGGTQKSAFWSWLNNIGPNGSTPLRRALKSVGSYYQTAQPWQTSSSDTSAYACRQSYTILTSDGFWNGDNQGVGNVDGSNGSMITGPNSRSYTYSPAAPYSDNRSETLADVAMQYWRTDLRGSLSNEVPTSTDDPAFWQHMTTFTLGMGFDPIGISPSDTTVAEIFDWANGGSAIGGFSWPTPSSSSVYNIADLAHAAVNGHGGFYSAKTPQAFASGIEDALARVVERTGAGASLSANSTELQTGTVTYKAIYNTGQWSGDLQAYSVDSSTGEISGTSNWLAVNMLPGATARTIMTYNPDTEAFVEFSDPATLSTDEQTALGANTAEQQAVIDYLRGDSSNEIRNGGEYRNRSTALGDIVSSQPIYSGAPGANTYYNETFTGSDAYTAFAADNASRTPLLWVAANDGMLHAFNASTGREVFAYLPAAVVLSDVASLTDPNYGASASAAHQYFNDGEVTISQVYDGEWKTVLVGTTGRGPAKAVYALDITRPANIQVLWERSAGDGGANSGYIGQMTGKPVIAQVADGRWAVLMGNGYNSASDQAALLQFDIGTGELDVYLTTDSTGGNGLAAPSMWIGDTSTGISTRAYAGDLHGQVWEIALDGSASNDTDDTKTTGSSLLFTAKDSGGNVQPITAGLLADEDTDTGNVWVFFGTGRYLSTDDLTDTSVQTWYGLIVESDTAGRAVTSSSTRSNLLEQSIIYQVDSSDSSLAARVLSSNTFTNEQGWYIDLLDPVVNTDGDLVGQTAQGERMVTPNQFQSNLLLGTSRIPKANDVCNPTGSGWIMAIDPYTGSNPESSFFDLNGDNAVDSADTVTIGGKTYVVSGLGFSSIPNNPIFVGNTMLTSFDDASTSSISTSGGGSGMSRVSWEELTTE